MDAGFAAWGEIANPNQSELDRFNRVKADINIPYLYPAKAKVNHYNLIPAATFGGIPSAAAFSADSRFPISTINRAGMPLRTTAPECGTATP